MSEKTKINWKWVGIGTAVAVFLSVLLFYITKETFGTFYLPAFLSLFGFLIMGIVVGYFSHGIVIKEASIAGAVSMVITVAIWRFFFDYYPPDMQLIVSPILGFVLGLVGSWVGEEMQGALKITDEAMSFKIYPGWIIAGTVFIYVSNNLVMFLTAPFFNYDDTAVKVSYAVSFLLASFFVGYKSPGTVVVESVVAGFAAVVLNNCVLYANLYLRGTSYAPVFSDVFTDLIYAVVFSFVGAFVGEKLQPSKKK